MPIALLYWYLHTEETHQVWIAIQHEENNEINSHEQEVQRERDSDWDIMLKKPIDSGINLEFDFWDSMALIVSVLIKNCIKNNLIS